MATGPPGPSDDPPPTWVPGGNFAGEVDRPPPTPTRSSLRPPPRASHRAVTILLGVFVAVVLVAFLWIVVLPSFQPPAGACGGAGAVFDLGNPNGSVGGASSQQAGSTYWYNFSFLHCAGETLTVGNLTLLSESARCAPVSGVVSYTLENVSRANVAVENATSERWGAGSETLLPQQGYLSVLSLTGLSEDGILAFGGPPASGSALITEPYSSSDTEWNCA